MLSYPVLMTKLIWFWLYLTHTILAEPNVSQLIDSPSTQLPILTLVSTR